MLTAAKLLAFSLPMWQASPEFGIEDAYKWLFHATQGGEHAILDASGPKAWMDREWASLGPPKPREPMVEWLRPDHRLLRLNLRPFKAAGGSKDPALKAFIASAKKFRPQRTEFTEVWRLLKKRLDKRTLGPLTAAGWTHLDQETKRTGYPAIDHSPRYEATLKPAYRVLTETEWRRIEPSVKRTNVKNSGPG